MTATLPAFLSPEIWLRQIFAARAATDGGIVRRQVRDVERIVGRARFEAELRHRGYRAVENAGQFVIFCNRAPVRLIE
ncbi:N-(5'-phosphoribosyl)anthranilate isomerase [Frigidibacter sp. RF13]|uniref:N-(5'-phosphoribosyl)anthranilate isomerase n=1 Tax=Frigidibacter sp. RF13 TaxID=2997340 RepID=UPI00226EFE31|nr:N-(5'-phosphoribosyl)anthranilate isomerase [Frigidibacter sp. RF13]MCY1127542.1 N-(5'-phosphoribosyl)anthranilate isomerase [Frigidibacter sp. RF13]